MAEKEKQVEQLKDFCGKTVRIKRTLREATLLSLANNGQKCFVRYDNGMKETLPAAEIEPLEPDAALD